MRGVLKANQVTYALVLNAAAGLLISPISWSHHWVWAAPALLTCLSTTNPNRRRPPTFAVLALQIILRGTLRSRMVLASVSLSQAQLA
jgi:alpha-1,2-mannosyltransferase